MNKINVCFATDNNYAKYMGLALMSVLKSANKEDNLHFFILDNNIKQEEKDKIATLQKIKPFKITYIPIDENSFSNLYVHQKGLSPTAYARFLISKLIDEDKVLYLDCDIFVRKSLAPLFNLDISNYYIAGVLDYAMRKSYLLSMFKDRNLVDNYLNSGVLLINNKKWQEESITDLLFKYARTHNGILHYADQDCLNYLLHSRVLKIGVTWNMYNHYYDPYLVYKASNKEEILKAQKDPAIRHFRPWKANNVQLFRDEYLEMMKTSPWSEFTPKDDWSFTNFMKLLFKYWLRYPAFFLTPKFYIRIRHLGFKNTILRVID